MTLSKAFLSLAVLAARLLPVPVKRLFYRIPPLARLIRGGLNRAVPSGLTEVEVAAGALAGAHMALDLKSEKDYWLGTYEIEVQAALRSVVRPGMTVYDVGANIGYITLQLARLLGESGRVFAFEALPDNVDRLKHNLEINRLTDRVKVIAAAVVDVAGPVRFLVAPSGEMGKVSGSAGRLDVNYLSEIEVDGCSLDEFCYGKGHPSPDLIKMDIEGGEILALHGMRRILNESRPVLLLELHGLESVKIAWDALTAARYRICRMQAGFPEVHSLEELDWKAYLAGFPPKDELGLTSAWNTA